MSARVYPNAAVLLEALGHVLGEDEETRQTWRDVWLRRVLTWVPLTLVAVVALGTLTSVAFNVTLGRAEFATETFWERTGWGVKSLVPPAFVLLLAWLALSVLLALRRVAIGLSVRARSLDERIRSRVAYLTRDPAVLSSGVLLLSAFSLVAAWLAFWPLIVAMTSFVRFAPRETIAVLDPSFAEYHDFYLLTFSVLAVGTSAAWLGASKIATLHRVTIWRGIVAGATVVVCLQMASLGISYRLRIHNALPAVSWKGETCYVTGERADRWLLFCPSRASDRNEVVRRGDPAVTDLKRLESLFTGIRGVRRAGES